MTTTPQKLRAGAIGDWIAIPGADGPMLADAMEIADSCARSDVECYTRSIHEGDSLRWWDTSSVTDVEDNECVTKSVRYLEATGLLERHPEHQEWVRMRDAA